MGVVLILYVLLIAFPWVESKDPLANIVLPKEFKKQQIMKMITCTDKQTCAKECNRYALNLPGDDQKLGVCGALEEKNFQLRKPAPKVFNCQCYWYRVDDQKNPGKIVIPDLATLPPQKNVVLPEGVDFTDRKNFGFVDCKTKMECYEECNDYASKIIRWGDSGDCRDYKSLDGVTWTCKCLWYNSEDQPTEVVGQKNNQVIQLPPPKPFQCAQHENCKETCEADGKHFFMGVGKCGSLGLVNKKRTCKCLAVPEGVTVSLASKKGTARYQLTQIECTVKNTCPRLCKSKNPKNNQVGRCMKVGKTYQCDCFEKTTELESSNQRTYSLERLGEKRTVICAMERDCKKICQGPRLEKTQQHLGKCIKKKEGAGGKHFECECITLPKGFQLTKNLKQVEPIPGQLRLEAIECPDESFCKTMCAERGADAVYAGRCKSYSSLKLTKKKSSLACDCYY